jgi:hypothetical protein
MLAVVATGAGACAAGGFAYARSRRVRLYRDLSARVSRVAAAQPFELGSAPERELPSFADRLAVLPQFLPEDAFARIAGEAAGLVGQERSFIPTHKKGGTVAYESLIAGAPAIVSLYHANAFQATISRLVGVPLVPTPIFDQSSLSLLFYDRPGDHIGWHYDHNFYRGRHFTVLLAIVNTGSAPGGLSHATLRARVGEREIAVATAPDTLVVFEGARVRHVVTPLLDGERRLILSMTYCADPRSTWWQGCSRRLKDTAYFGIRALWT